MEDKRLIQSARLAQSKAQAKYSGFKVGAALLTDDGRIFTGCNVESSSYGLSICAERVALVKALSEGATEFVKIAVYTGGTKPAAPCGACRQLLWDYAPDIEIISVAGENIARYNLKQLYPYPFDDSDFAESP